MSLRWDKSADVVIVGYGGAGAVAAITAHDYGSKVLILEKQPADTPTEILHTPSTRMSGGLFICPKDVSEAAEHLEALSSGATSRSVCEAWAEYTSQNVKWLRKMGAEIIDMEIPPEFPFLPGSTSIKVYRVKYKGIAGGPALYWLLSDQVGSRGIEIMYNTPVKKLVMNKMRQIIGVRADNAGKGMTVKAKRAVILTCGGFEWDDEMKLNYLRAAPFFFYCNPGNTGDGVRMAQKVGAKLWHMNTVSGRVIPKFPDTEPAMAGGTPENHFILVDKYGRRFARERPWASHSFWLEVCYFNADKAEYPRIPCYSIFDEVARLRGPVVRAPVKGALPDGRIQYFHEWSILNTVEIEKNWIIKGNSIEELARELEIDPSVLKDTIFRYNSFCKSGEDLEFSRAKETLNPIDTPPFYALKMFPGGPNTQGGPKRNSKSQVLDVEDNPIPRLYAAGELGSVYGFLYPCGGGNIAELIAFGRIAGKYSAAESRWC